MKEAITEKILKGTPISRLDATTLYLEAPMGDLKELAQIVKSKHHKNSLDATYVIMSIINYTNICIAGCDYCSFYRFPHQSDAYMLSFEELIPRIDDTIKLGASIISFNGGFHPKLKIDDYAALFAKLTQKYPDLTVFSMTVAEFMFSCKLSKITYTEGAKLLYTAGVRWITGGGAEILDDAFRKRHSPGKYKTDDYFHAQRCILETGISSTATMVIGFDESLEERMNHLEALRNFQSNGKEKLSSFLCWTYKPFHNKLGGQEINTEEYLRWLAVCRIYLGNFKHIRTSVLTQNEKALVGLAYGADDFDLPIEDEVTQKAGATISHDFSGILSAAKNQGFNVIHRKPFRPWS